MIWNITQAREGKGSGLVEMVEPSHGYHCTTLPGSFYILLLHQELPRLPMSASVTGVGQRHCVVVRKRGSSGSDVALTTCPGESDLEYLFSVLRTKKFIILNETCPL